MSARDDATSGASGGNDASDAHGGSLAVFFLVGLFLGVVFIQSQVASWFRIQEMFRFDAVHMYGIIGSAVAVAAASTHLMKRATARTVRGEDIVWPARPRPGSRHVLGGTVFGLGWGVLGACPGPIYALIGSGLTVFVAALVAAVAGAWTYGLLRDRLPH